MLALFNVIAILGFIVANDAKTVIIVCPVTSVAEAKKAEGPLADFAVNFYKKWSSNSTDENLVFSPVSLALALSLLESGADGATREEIKNVLAKAGAHEDVISSYVSLQQYLEIDEPLTTLSIANGMFPHKTFSLLPEFVRKLKYCFPSEAQTVDYTQKLEEARQEINNWVSNKTMSKIPELFKPQVLTADVVLVLANAIYFKSNWKDCFKQSSTQKKLFFRSGRGNGESVSFMHGRGLYGYVKTPYLELLELPYNNTNFSMYFLLPTAKDGLAAMENGLDGEKLRGLIGQGKPADVKVQLPKFTIRTSIDLKKILTDMKLGTMFTPAAEFGRMSARPLSVSKGVHEAFIKINENGTEAAAATGFSLVPRTTTNLDFVADHPFLYAIVHKPTGAVIFLGKVNYVQNEEN